MSQEPPSLPDFKEKIDLYQARAISFGTVSPETAVHHGEILPYREGEAFGRQGGPETGIPEGLPVEHVPDHSDVSPSGGPSGTSRDLKGL